MTESLTSASTFLGLGLSTQMLDVLTRCRFTTPTPIQHQSIPAGIAGKDLIGIAQTGTGKTLAFSLPLIERLKDNKSRGLILLPTRELALQVDETLQKIGKTFGMTTAVLIGGESFGRQIDALRRNPRIIVATPGRLLDHLEQKSARLDDVRIAVLDEADRMLDMGFAPQINRILASLPRDRQTLLYSATMPSEIAKIAATYMKMPVRVEVAPAGTSAEQVEQEIIFVDRESKLALLETMLEECRGTVITFTRTKHRAKSVCRALNRKGFHAAEIHSNRSLAQRREALDGFKRGKYQVLVATDIAARGIDVKNIELVVNFDLPDQSEDYVHRIGRTGRAGSLGRAVSFATHDQKRDVKDIERLIRKALKIIPLPKLPEGAHTSMEAFARDERPDTRANPRPPRASRPQSRPRSQTAAKPNRTSGDARRGDTRQGQPSRAPRNDADHRQGPSPQRRRSRRRTSI